MPALVIIAVAGMLAVCVCRYAMPIATKLNLLDVPGERKKHKAVTPLIGGVILLTCFTPAAFAIIAGIAATSNHFKLTVWLLASVGMTLVGLADDRHALSPRLRLLLSFLIFGLAAYIDPNFTVRVLDFEHPKFSLGLGTREIAIFFTIVCCVGLVNAINMADGKNGLVIGLCIGWLILLALRAPPIFHTMILLLIAILAVLLIFNLGNRLFLGDGGAYGFASAIGLLAIAIYNDPGSHAIRDISAEELMVLFSVPVFDSFRLTYKRLRKGQSPMAADRDHLHHHLQDRFGWPRGLLLYWIIALLPAAICLSYF